MGRSWVYSRLREHARAGRAVQTAPGAWRAITPRLAGRETAGPRTIALSAARDLLTQAVNVIAGTIIDLIRPSRVLDNLLPGRWLRVSP
jgi:hypothetical protein